MHKKQKSGKRVIAALLTGILTLSAAVSTNVHAMPQYWPDDETIKPTHFHSLSTSQFANKEELLTLSDTIDADTVLFGSRVLPVPQEHTDGEVNIDDEDMTLRYQADDLGEAKIISENGKSYIELNNIPETYQEGFGDIRLVVQAEASDGTNYAWSCKAENGKKIYPEDITVNERPLNQFLEEELIYEANDAFTDCEVWLETTDYENLTSLAAFPKLERRDTEPPTITAEDKRLYIGDIFDESVQLQGVTAKDYKGNDLTEHIKVVSCNVPVEPETNAITQAGTFEIKYSVTDANGQTTEATAQVIVEDLPVPTGIDDSSHTGSMLFLIGSATLFSFITLETLHRRRQRR